MHRVPSFCRIPRILMVSVWSTGFFYCSFVSEMVFLLLLNQFNGVFPVKELAACCRTLNSEKRDHRSLSLTLHIFYLYIYIYVHVHIPPSLLALLSLLHNIIFPSTLYALSKSKYQIRSYPTAVGGRRLALLGMGMTSCWNCGAEALFPFQK